MLKVGWFSTGRDQAAIDLLKTVTNAITKGIIKADISFCFANRAPGESETTDMFFNELKEYGIPLIYISSKDFRPDDRKRDLETWRDGFDTEVIRLIRDRKVDLIVLAGYMLIVSPKLCSTFNMINLHPALPGGPTGTWQEVIQRLLETGSQVTGAMTHLVTPELDRGQPISFFKFPISGMSFNEIRNKGVEREMPLILVTIKEFADGNLRIEHGKVYAGSRVLENGYDLTDKIEEWLKR